MMRVLLETRWLLIKHKLWRTLLWLFLPLMMTYLIAVLVNETSDDFRIPVAMVVEDDDGEITSNIMERLTESEYMDLSVYYEDESSAVMHSLEQYNYDSVFIIPEDFEESIEEGNRRNIVEAYYTDRSLFYEPTKEVIASIIQEKLGEDYAVEQVFRLQEEYLEEAAVGRPVIISQMEKIEKETNLVTQSFRVDGERDNESEDIVDPLYIWAYLTLLFTMSVFDFIVSERKNSVSERFIFMRWTHKTYMLLNFLLFTMIILALDFITFTIFSNIFDIKIEIVPFILFRVVVNMTAFLVAVYKTKLIHFYRTAVFLVCMLFACQIMLPFIQIPYITYLHPVAAALNGGFNIIWLVILTILIFVWKRGK